MVSFTNDTFPLSVLQIWAFHETFVVMVTLWFIANYILTARELLERIKCLGASACQALATLALLVAATQVQAHGRGLQLSTKKGSSSVVLLSFLTDGSSVQATASTSKSTVIYDHNAVLHFILIKAALQYLIKRLNFYCFFSMDKLQLSFARTMKNIIN